MVVFVSIEESFSGHRIMQQWQLFTSGEKVRDLSLLGRRGKQPWLVRQRGRGRSSAACTAAPAPASNYGESWLVAASSSSSLLTPAVQVLEIGCGTLTWSGVSWLLRLGGSTVWPQGHGYAWSRLGELRVPPYSRQACLDSAWEACGEGREAYLLRTLCYQM